MSQARGKSKEHVQNYLSEIFNDRDFETSGRISDPKVKESRAKALADLAQGDRFIWEPPMYELDKSGNIQRDEADKPIIKQHVWVPFTGPYVRNALQFLFLEDIAEWKNISGEKFTAPQIAFTVTLVCLLSPDTLKSL